jgi:redox-sensitive bicupin YhaK (pirin superfamily)
MITQNDPSLVEQQLKVTKRPAEARGKAEHGWLHARFTFSFGEYFDPDYMGFRSIRVMNNDTIEPRGGFPLHPHRDAEIFTYVVRGELQHSDSLGNGSIISAGNLQYMSAGSGIRHSEFNPSSENETHLYQIWLRSSESGGEPRYAEKSLSEHVIQNDLTLLFSCDGRGESTAIRQRAEIYFGRVEEGKALTVPVSRNMPHSWIQVIDGQVNVMGEDLATADGLAIENAPDEFPIEAVLGSSVLVFRLS